MTAVWTVGCGRQKFIVVYLPRTVVRPFRPGYNQLAFHTKCNVKLACMARNYSEPYEEGSTLVQILVRKRYLCQDK